MTVAWEKLIIRSLMKGTHIYAKITERHHDSYTFSPFVYLQSRASLMRVLQIWQLNTSDSKVCTACKDRPVVRLTLYPSHRLRIIVFGQKG